MNEFNFPDEIRALPNWSVWQLQYKDAKPVKKPLNCHNPKYGASSMDPGSWSTIAHAKTHIDNKDLPTNGYAFRLTPPYIGIDLDKCRNPETGIIEEWAQNIIKALNTYTEISQSQKGIHCIVKGTIPNAIKNDRFEMYATGRYFALTGDVVGTSNQICENKTVIDKLFNLYNKKVDVDPNQRPPIKIDGSIEEIIKIAKESNPGFKLLWEGKWDEDILCGKYPSHSEADQALCNHLAFWFGRDYKLIDQAFQLSKMWRQDKWGRKDYKDRTINNAIAGCKDCYNPNEKNKRKEDHEDLENIFKNKNDKKQVIKKKTIRFKDLMLLADIERKKTYLIQDYLPGNGLTVFSSKPMCGKTTTEYFKWACLITGECFFDKYTEQSYVLYINADGNPADIIVDRLLDHCCDLLPHYTEDEIINLIQERFLCVNLDYDVVDNNYITACKKEIEEYSNNKNIENLYVCIDTFRSACLKKEENASENDAVAMVKVLSPLRTYARNEKISICILHHNAKTTGELSGSTAIEGCCDCYWNMSRDKESNISEILITNRRPGMLPKLFIECTQDNKLSLTKEELNKNSKIINVIKEILLSFKRELTINEILESDINKENYKYDYTAIRNALNRKDACEAAGITVVKPAKPSSKNPNKYKA